MRIEAERTHLLSKMAGLECQTVASTPLHPSDGGLGAAKLPADSGFGVCVSHAVAKRIGGSRSIGMIENFIVDRPITATRAWIPLPARAANQLAIDSCCRMRFADNHVQSAGIGHRRIQRYIGPSSRHIGRDGDPFGGARRLHPLGFTIHVPGV